MKSHEKEEGTRNAIITGNLNAQKESNVKAVQDLLREQKVTEAVPVKYVTNKADFICGLEEAYPKMEITLVSDGFWDLLGIAKKFGKYAKEGVLLINDSTNVAVSSLLGKLVYAADSEHLGLTTKSIERIREKTGNHEKVDENVDLSGSRSLVAVFRKTLLPERTLLAIEQAKKKRIKAF